MTLYLKDILTAAIIIIAMGTVYFVTPDAQPIEQETSTGICGFNGGKCN